MKKSAADCSKHIELTELLTEKYGAQPRFIAMLDAAKSALRELSGRIRDKDLEIDGLTTELDQKMRAPAYQQWLSRQAAQASESVRKGRTPRSPVLLLPA